MEKGFLDEGNPFVQYAVMDDDVGRVSGHEKDLQPRVHAHKLQGQILAVHLGHHHIRDQQVDLPVVFPGQAGAPSRPCQR